VRLELPQLPGFRGRQPIAVAPKAIGSDVPRRIDRDDLLHRVFVIDDPGGPGERMAVVVDVITFAAVAPLSRVSRASAVGRILSLPGTYSPAGVEPAKSGCNPALSRNCEA
jgi:hypothetical protein